MEVAEKGEIRQMNTLTRVRAVANVTDTVTQSQC